MFQTTHKKATDVLSSLYDFLEDHDFDDIDSDGKSLTVKITAVGTYLFSDHYPTQQLWVSSPVSGAHHFHYVDGVWCSTRDKVSFNEFIHNELMVHIQ